MVHLEGCMQGSSREGTYLRGQDNFSGCAMYKKAKHVPRAAKWDLECAERASLALHLGNLCCPLVVPLPVVGAGC